jgi:hypothetical protein
MISLSDFGTVSLRWLARRGNHEPSHRGDHIGGLETGVLLSASPEFCCPSARSLLSAYREYELSALSQPQGRRERSGLVTVWQSKSQLEAIYGAHADTILTN